jgi:hypothetical protein
MRQINGATSEIEHCNIAIKGMFITVVGEDLEAEVTGMRVVGMVVKTARKMRLEHMVEQEKARIAHV